MLNSDKWSPSASLENAQELMFKVSQEISTLRWHYDDGTPKEAMDKLDAIVLSVVDVLQHLSHADCIFQAVHRTWKYPELEKCLICNKDLAPGEKCDYCPECEAKQNIISELERRAEEKADDFDPFRDLDVEIECDNCHEKYMGPEGFPHFCNNCINTLRELQKTVEFWRAGI